MHARPDPFWIDEPFIRQTGTGNEHYHTDALGSSLALSNSAGVAATTYTYEPFGRTTTAGSSGNSFQYTGRENDGTGLSYYRARYYNPTLQRFVGEDPIGFGGGDTNLYAYVRNNPTNLIDPTGEAVPLILILPVVGGLINGVSSAFNASQACDASAISVIEAFGNGGAAGFFGSVVGLGVGAVTGNPFLGGAAGGLAGNLVQ